MNHQMPSEARIAALIAAYADRAPTAVDPVGMAGLAAAGSARRRVDWTGLGPAERGLAYLFLVFALVVALATGALVVGGQLRDDPIQMLTGREFVEPFIGLPPEGTPPSTPETGQLVVGFGGRISSLAGDLFRMWLYADGRLIWKSNLEGSGRSNPAFGATPATLAVIEQRLTPEGVALMRSEVLKTARVLDQRQVGADGTWDPRPGTGWYSNMTLGQGDQLFDAIWTDHRLPARLADPGSWLPASAWADRRLGGFVPAKYGVCAWPGGPQGATFDGLPEPARSLILSSTRPVVVDPAEPRGDCSAVDTAVARELVAALDAAGTTRAEHATHGVEYRFRDEAGRDVDIRILPIVPHGEVVCSCG